jgi:hypothetical protein
MATSDDVSRVLRGETFRRARAFDRRSLIQRANEVGPAMRLLHWDRLKSLGRLAAFSEGCTEDAVEGINRFGAPSVEIFMVSHRWLRPSLDDAFSHPDDASNTKAKALAEFAQWRRCWVQRRHGFEPEIFYWLDFSCFDQQDVANNLPMLPLWVACCERMLRYETDDYHDRAWCRLELLLSYTFAFADHHVAIRAGFVASKSGDGSEEGSLLRRPTEGMVTHAGDIAGIAALERFACEFEPATVDRITGKPLQRAKFGESGATASRMSVHGSSVHHQRRMYTE